jgi:formate dehydrogenase subunit gamma
MVYCLGNCALSPSISIDDEVYGRVTPQEVVRHIQEATND